jgi:hypothetical protein
VHFTARKLQKTFSGTIQLRFSAQLTIEYIPVRIRAPAESVWGGGMTVVLENEVVYYQRPPKLIKDELPARILWRAELQRLVERVKFLRANQKRYRNAMCE